MARDVVKEIRKEIGLPDIEKRNRLKSGLIKAGIVGAGVIGLSSMANATSIFYRDEQGNETDLKNQTITQTKIITFNINGLINSSGYQSPILVGTKGYLQIPFNGTITEWSIFETSETPISGSIVVDVWKDTTGNYPPTSGDSIAGTEKPTLTSQTNASDTSLNTWTTNINIGDVIGINVDSNSGCKNILIQIKMVVN